jgi:hypothetical protein
MTVPLPEQGDGSRRRRREEKARRGQRTIIRLVAALALVAVVGGLGWFIVDLVVGDDDGPRRATDATPTDTEVAGPGPGLLVLTDLLGVVYGVTVFQPETASILHVPPGTLVEVPSLGLTSLRDAAGEGGLDLLQQSLENLLGVSFEAATTLDPAAISALTPSMTVAVRDAVEERDDAGRVTVVVPAGAFTVDDTNAATFLSVVGAGTSLDRLVRHQSFWTAYLDEGGPDAPLDAIAALRGDVQQRVLPVEAVAGIEGDEELYRVVERDLETLVGRLFPSAPRGGSERIRVRILNGVGAPGVAQEVQPLLVAAGGRMTLSGNADRFDYAVTQVVYYDDAHRESAEAIREALGVGEVVKSLAELAVVDVTVVVGADFLASRSGG